VKIARAKWEILEWLGYIFCESSFRWWNLFDDTPVEQHPTRWDVVTYLVGVPTFKIGCFFYNLQDDEAAGVIYKRVDYEEEE